LSFKQSYLINEELPTQSSSNFQRTHARKAGADAFTFDKN
jgi:hypothetical protein